MRTYVEGGGDSCMAAVEIPSPTGRHGAHWTGHQSITGPTHTHSHLKVSSYIKNNDRSDNIHE